jgi:hypothetical protein
VGALRNAGDGPGDNVYRANAHSLGRESFGEQIFPFIGLRMRELNRVRENHLNSIEFFL